MSYDTEKTHAEISLVRTVYQAHQISLCKSSGLTRSCAALPVEIEIHCDNSGRPSDLIITDPEQARKLLEAMLEYLDVLDRVEAQSGREDAPQS